MEEEFRQLLSKYPLIASKDPGLDLLDENAKLNLFVEQSPLYRKLWAKQRKKFARLSTDTGQRKLAEPADRFREITRTHPVEADSSIEWPKLDPHRTIDVAASVEARESHQKPLGDAGKDQRLLRLFRDLAKAISRALSQPSPTFEDRYSVRIEFLDCIAWVALKMERVMKMEIRDANGDWQLSAFRFNLLKPMHLPSWLDQVLLSRVDEIVLSFNEDAEHAYEWLRNRLKETFHNDAALGGIRQQVSRCMSVNPGMIEALQRIRKCTGKRLELFNAECSEAWQAGEFWSEINQKYPDLTVLCYWATKSRQIQNIINVDQIRSILTRRGLSPSGWRYLLREGENCYLSVHQSGIDEAHAFTVSLGLIEWQSRARLEGGLSKELAIAFVNFMALTMLEGQDLAAHVNPRIAQSAQKHYANLSTDGDRTSFAQRDWIEVLIWLRNSNPRIDKNQWKSGWKSIWRNYQNWRVKHQQSAEWQSALPEFSTEELRIRPLMNSGELCLEGMKMHHCIATYAPDCRANTYRVFSLRDGQSDQRLATVGLYLRSGVWRLDQVKGNRNQGVNRHLKSFAQSLADYYQQAELMNRARAQQLAAVHPDDRQADFESRLVALKVSEEGDLMERNCIGQWVKADVSSVPISSGLKKAFTCDRTDRGKSIAQPGVEELTVRLRLELPGDYLVYLHDRDANQERLLTLV